MTSDQNKCSLSSLLPMSCQGRAEAFARRLHSRLRSLGSTENEPTSENSWLTAPENSVTSSQPRQNDPDLYFDFGTLESPPGSPEEEIDGQEIEEENVINEDNLKLCSSCPNDAKNQISNNNSQCLTKESINGYAKAEEIKENITEVNNRLESCNQVNHNETEFSLSENVQNGSDHRKHDLTNSISQDIDDDNDIEEPTPRVRRCSSLKTGKTPPGTPASKKIVRFADVLGLDLADVRTFLDEIPKIPNSAYVDLTEADLSDSSTTNINSGTALNKLNKVLIPLFQQPGGQPDFIDRIRETQVCLDNALVDDPVLLSISGTVRVKNLDFHKSVHIRYTLDSWQTFSDVPAVYVENSCDGFSDKFSFTIFANTLSVGQKLEFAIRFQCKGCQYWDSNKGVNYCFQCLPPMMDSTPATPSLTGIDDNWAENLY